MTRRVWHRWLAAGLCIVLAGCSASAPLKTYVLGTPTLRPASAASEMGLPTLELRTVSVPDYLDSSDILRRTGANELTASPDGRWGERLSQGITHALSEALSSRLPGVVVSTDIGERPTRRLFVNIERAEIAADGRCVIVARWRIAKGEAPVTLASARGSFTAIAEANTDAADAAALTDDIAQLAAG